MGGFHSAVYGGHLYLVCAVCDVTISHHIHVSKPTFWRSCWHYMHILLHALSLNQRSKLGYRRKINSTIQQFLTAKISGCTLKHGSKKRLSLRQNYLELQNKAALMSHRIRAVEHRNCAAGLSDAHPGLQDRILLNYTRIENVHKVRKKTFDFGLCIDVQQIFSFPFWLLRH